MTGFTDLPDELQVHILKYCDKETLDPTCEVSRDMYEKALPILWETISFQHTLEYVGPQASFLMLFDRLLAEQKTDRIARFAPLVKTLEFITMPAINVRSEAAGYNRANDYKVCREIAGDRNIYDIVALFPKLQRLSLFVKDWWGPDSLLDSQAAAIQNQLTGLRDVEIGGQIALPIILALLARPEQIERLSLINLIHKPPLRCGPAHVAFLDTIGPRLARLTHLHLCKLADFGDREPLASHPPMDVLDEREQIQEWARLLPHVCTTLITLELDNSYPLHAYSDSTEQLQDVDDRDPETRQCGRRSSDLCKEILFPAIAKLPWPLLRGVTLRGIYLDDSTGSPSPFEGMNPQVRVNSMRAMCIQADNPAVLYNASVDDLNTPMTIYPPRGMFDADKPEDGVIYCW